MISMESHVPWRIPHFILLLNTTGFWLGTYLVRTANEYLIACVSSTLEVKDSLWLIALYLFLPWHKQAINLHSIFTTYTVQSWWTVQNLLPHAFLWLAAAYNTTQWHYTTLHHTTLICLCSSYACSYITKKVILTFVLKNHNGWK